MKGGGQHVLQHLQEHLGPLHRLKILSMTHDLLHFEDGTGHRQL